MIEAAGGVVLRPAGDHDAEVLVVHRPDRGDWSLPKGKLDPGESPRAAAVREVEEETCVRAQLGAKIGSYRYEAAAGPKRVRWYLMTPIAGDPAQREPDKEIGQAAWWSLQEAYERLTYTRDRDLLREAVERWTR